tara:strand:- start:421 stop:609 length:189 start_codon:yes stop_codon:yes gene_type:complete
MALAIAAILTLALILAIPASLVFLAWEDHKRASHFRLHVLPKLQAQDAKRRDDRASRFKVSL